MKSTFIMSDETKKQVQKWIYTIGGCPESMKGTPTGEVLEDVLGAFGKMIRPGLLMACASLGPDFQDKLDRLYFLGALVELTHLSSLIHDDIIDDAPLRRGKASIQGKYGKDAAVYAGDFLIARINYWEAKEHANEAAELLAQAVEAMCIGEIGQALCRYNSDVTCQQYYDNIKGKTAALFQTACRIGSLTTGCDEKTVQNLDHFGYHLGIMFQLRDDLIDFATNGSGEGKKTHKDFQDGIYTLPVLIAMQSEECRNKLLPIMEANKERILTDEEIADMEALVIRYGGVEGTWKEILSRAAKCNEILDSLGPCVAAAEMKGLLSLLIKQ